MAITAKEVNQLRKMTGAGMMDCKKALVESDGDFDKAIEILRKKGQKVSEKRAGRDTKEGSVFIRTSEDGSYGVLIAMGCETDFVAKNDEFQRLGQDIVDRAFEEKPESLEALKSLKIGELTVEDKITEFVGKIGEKLDILAYETLTSELVVPYVHAGSKLGVMVALKNVSGDDLLGVGRDVAMQIAAMSPVSVDKDDVPQEIVDRELKIGREQAIAEGKPEKIIDRIAEGKLNKYFKDNTLLNQTFVKDNSLSVGKYLQSVQDGLTVAAFRRVVIG